MRDTLRFADEPIRPLHDGIRALQRGAFGQLHGNDNIALILLRDKTPGNPVNRKDSHANQDRECDKRDHLTMYDPARRTRVTAARRAKGAIKPLEERANQATYNTVRVFLFWL